MSALDDETQLDPNHPRRRYNLFGQNEAEKMLLEAYRSGKMHHGWILGGPEGIGKATLAYRFARFILRNPDPTEIPVEVTNLAVDRSDPVARRIAAEGHSDLLTIARPWDPKSKKFKQEIGAAEARKAAGFFTKTAGEGGWRICVVDPADALNAVAANALLKVLEEPPERTLFLLVANVPGRLMATIRSRCVQLNLTPLNAENMRLVLTETNGATDSYPEEAINTALSWAAGSPGKAIKILETGLFERLREFQSITNRLPILSLGQALKFAERLSARGAEDQYALFCDLFLNWISVQARKALEDEGELPVSAALANAYDEIGRSIRRTNALNLDKRQTIVHGLQRLEIAWSGTAPA